MENSSLEIFLILMKIESLPTTYEELQKIIEDAVQSKMGAVISQIGKMKEQLNASREELAASKVRIDYLNERNQYLEEQLKLFTSWRFDRRSEKALPDETHQYRLFNEAEEGVVESITSEATMVVPEHVRKKGGRKPISDKIPRIEIIHDLPESEKTLADGTQLKEIKEETKEIVVSIPKTVYVEKHIHKVYAVPENVEVEGSRIRTAPVKPQMIPKSMASSSLLADVLTSKFCDALPFYRQEKIFERHGVDLPRQTMCQWSMKIHENAKVLQDIMEEDLLKSQILGMDETRVQVLSEADRSNTLNSYMWVCRGGESDKPILLYQYNQSRGGKVVTELLKGYRGYLQCDGYAGYDSGTANLEIKLVGCWAHARRKFKEVEIGGKNTTSAQEALKQIQELYKIESEARDQKLEPDALRKKRQSEAIPILNKFKEWLDKRSVQVPPKSLIGKAVLYALGEWDKLVRYTEDGHIPIDNNLVENAIRPFVVGRKNWLFSGSPGGAEASAFIYSLIETAKANDIEPYWYLFYLFDKFPLARGEDDYRRLLPYNVAMDDLSAHFDKHPTLTAKFNTASA